MRELYDYDMIMMVPGDIVIHISSEARSTLFFIQSSSSTLFWGVTFHNGPIAQRDVWLLFVGNGLHRLHRVFIGSTHRHRHYCLPDMSDIGLGRSGPHSTHFCLPHCIRTNKSCLSKHYWSLLYLSNSIRQNKYWFLFFGKQIHLVLVNFFLCCCFGWGALQSA